MVRFGFCPMESDLKHLAEGEKLRLGQAGALVPRTEQDHMSVPPAHLQ